MLAGKFLKDCSGLNDEKKIEKEGGTNQAPGLFLCITCSIFMLPRVRQCSHYSPTLNQDVNCQLSIASPKKANTNLMWPYKLAINCLSVFIVVALTLCTCVLKPFQGPCNLDIVTCVKYLVHMLKAVCIALFSVVKAGFMCTSR